MEDGKTPELIFAVLSRTAVFYAAAGVVLPNGVRDILMEEED